MTLQPRLLQVHTILAWKPRNLSYYGRLAAAVYAENVLYQEDDDDHQYENAGTVVEGFVEAVYCWNVPLKDLDEGRPIAFLPFDKEAQQQTLP